MSNDILETIRGIKKKVYHLTPATEAQVAAAEEALGLKFADDYREYVLEYGEISAGSMELTGITTSKRLDVVNVTKKERELSELPSNMYVVENLAIDGRLILQDAAGKIYTISPGRQPKLLCDSLSEYIRQATV